MVATIQALTRLSRSSSKHAYWTVFQMLTHHTSHTGQIFNTYAASHGSLYPLRPDGHVMARWREAVASEVAQAVKDVLQ
jgi:hypothetical protein